MAAEIIDGKKIAAGIRQEIAGRVANFRDATGASPHLAAVLVGADPASQVYVRNKRKACEDVGIQSSLFELPSGTTSMQLLELVGQLNADREVDGILVQFPLPPPLSEFDVLTAIDPAKDVDGFHPCNVGLVCEGRPRFVPCTPAGVVRLLHSTGVELPGKRVAILGRSSLVGRPLANLLSQKGSRADATVTLCHSRTKDIETTVRQAEVVIAAIGRPEFVRGSMIQPGAVVIDVGINRLADGRLVGDVHFEEALATASAVTPVPGGVGPMTIAMLLENTLKAAESGPKAARTAKA